MRYQRKVFERYLTVAEERQLLAHINQFKSLLAQRDHAWIRFARHTGARIEALCGFTCFDAREALRTGVVVFRAEILKGRKRGGASHQVHANSEAQRALRDLLRIRRAMGHAEQADAPLLMSRNHRPISHRTLQMKIKVWATGAGLRVAGKVSPHWLRHTFAKRIVNQSTAENPILIAQQALGHSDINSTVVYTLPDREQMARAIEEAA